MSIMNDFMFPLELPQEKWDSVTRKWRDYKSLVQLVQLFLVDEVHQLNDETRGPTMEAIVSRMKTIQASLTWTQKDKRLRFIAVSATIPNISDVCRPVTFACIGIICMLCKMCMLPVHIICTCTCTWI